MNLFSSAKTATPVVDPNAATRAAVQQLQATLEQTEKRMRHIEMKAERQKKEAVAKSRNKDKRGALFCLKRKRMYEKDVEKMVGAQLTLQQQIISLEGAVTSLDVFRSMQLGAKTMKSIHSRMSIDDVDDVVSEIEEQNDVAEDIANALQTNVGDLYDDDELEQELEDLLEDDVEQAMQKALGKHLIPTTTQPVISDHQDGVNSVSERELAELEELTASMQAITELPPAPVKVKQKMLVTQSAL